VTAYLVYPITLKLNISAFRQNIKNLIGNFGAISMWALCMPNKQREGVVDPALFWSLQFSFSRNKVVFRPAKDKLHRHLKTTFWFSINS